ncbi:hypothetical protein TPHA_0D01700 [Tetrapisispora phaffii CBS 4417]|uniref:Uncharacterized protein n=1 Tax=Tetrapisispora phaffii (strain ATCC 24235 / CBS 4417 / NBRC 1672 / NRRL Y-8282 / UCD 70-5) TaxID=1071381 RepID=G8BSI9_TETPH|nr:hypothetical protein TPHA_0D01700 [Tetrapisispora phaffii CBS 4417]CCE62810.1 hypothetical protein TPHA_0D01700 [Tetrapisispora phaffii CBS 4417]
MVEFTVDVCLFDLDGTIVNSIEAVELAWIKLCKAYNVDHIEVLKFSHGVRSIDVLVKFFPDIDNTDNAGVKLLESSIATEFANLVKLIPGSKDLLLSLDVNTDGLAYGERKWAIVTSGSPYSVFSWFDNILKDVKKPDIFITGFDVKAGKPDPEGYASAKEQLCKLWKFDSQKARAVVFEDAPAGVIAGKAMGATVVGITSSHSKEVLFEAGADYVVYDLTQVSVVKNTRDDGITIKVVDPISKY